MIRRTSALERLEAVSRVALAHLPTPLEPLRALTAHCGGADIWIKRDDCTGLGLGGNKTRKLEYLLAEARAAGADTVITVGGVQSNHARQTAAGAARLGMRCELVLPRVVPRAGHDYDESGNLLLDRLFGAHVFVVADEAAAARKIQERLAAAAERGAVAVVHPPGGSTPTGVLGYVSAGLELASQLAEGGPELGRIFVAASTGGTLAGLLCGVRFAGLDVPITGVRVAGTADGVRADIGRLGCEVTATLDGGVFDEGSIHLEDAYLGEGYGIPTPAALEAIELCARLEGVLLDPVYTGKAMAAAIDAARRSAPPDPALLFWHTGGAPALFAYRQEIAEASAPPGD